SKKGNGQNAQYHHDQGNGEAFFQPVQEYHQCQGTDPDSQAEGMQQMQTLQDIAQKEVQASRGHGVHPQDMVQLSQSDQDGRCSAKATDDRSGQKVDKEAHAQQPQEQLYAPDHYGQQKNGLYMVPYIHQAQGPDPGGDQKGIHGHRANGQLPRGPHKGIDQLGVQGGLA